MSQQDITVTNDVTTTDRNNSEIVIEMILRSLHTGTETDNTASIPTNQEKNNSETPPKMEDIIRKNNLDFKQAVAFELMCTSFLLVSLQEEGIDSNVNHLLNLLSHAQGRCLKSNYLKLRKELIKRGAQDQLIMLLSGMGGTGKSEVINACYDYAEKLSSCFGWHFDENTIVITALLGSAATDLKNGRTLHSAAFLRQKIKDEQRIPWKGTKMLIIDEISFMTVSQLIKTDKQMRLLKKCTQLYGKCHIIFAGDFHQLQPIGGTALFAADTVQFGAINKAIFLNITWRYKDDPEFGDIMRRFRNGHVTEQDIDRLNSRYIENDNVNLPPVNEMRFACSNNQERNAISNYVFLKHLEKTHEKSNDTSISCPDHTVIIKGSMRYKSKRGPKLRTSTQNKIYDDCGDADVKNGEGKKMDPALKFYHGIPLMINTNKRIKERLANGTCCYGMYIVLRKNCKFKPECWEGYMVNTIQASEVAYIICKREKKKKMIQMSISN